MKAFAALLERLALTPARNGKLRLLTDYFRAVPDPDRGLALAAISRDLDIPTVKPTLLRELVTARIDAELFALSYDYVGDLAETVALIWDPRGNAADPALGEVVERLDRAGRGAAPVMEGLLDCLETSERYALVKLATGGLRVGVSARLAKQALANYGQFDVAEVEELWHGLVPPYREVFAWAEGRAPKPKQAAAAPFRPVMLASPLPEGALTGMDPDAYLAEWKWDGIRVQAVSDGSVRRLYSRRGDDISKAFPDVLAHMGFEGALDGELLVRLGADGPLGAFSDLQQRLNRKTVSKPMMERLPAFVRVYDLLAWGDSDLRALPFQTRRARLEGAIAALPGQRFDLSPLVPIPNWAALSEAREAPPEPVIEGVMIKRRDSAYVPGRPKGPWFKWKHDPHIIDAVLMYAQRGHGKRSSYYSDYTFGVWTAEGALVPVGKAYFGFTDEELSQIDKYVRDNTVERFGPVRSIRAEAAAGLVLEVAFEGLNRSKRHKSGLAMRFPRISRLRWDKLPGEADRIETLEALLPPESAP